jgi:hypothetical protein
MTRSYSPMRCQLREVLEQPATLERPFARLGEVALHAAGECRHLVLVEQAADDACAVALEGLGRHEAEVRALSLSPVAERRRNRTYPPPGCDGVPVLKTGWGTSPVPLRGEG